MMYTEEVAGMMPVERLGVDARATFISKTYLHLVFAIIGFTLLEVMLFRSGYSRTIATAMLSVPWLVVLGGFILLSWGASRLAHTAESLGVQYLALAGFVVLEALIFVPMLYIANHYAPGAIQSAAAVTLMGFSGLTAVVFFTRKDFSFLKGLLGYGFILALVLIVASSIFGFKMGTWFSVGMVGLAGAAVLYDTSNILHHFPEDRYVGAALELFASIALMFWYVLQLFMGGRD